MSRPKSLEAERSGIIVRNLQRTVRIDVADLRSFARRALAACAAIPGPRSFPQGEVTVLIISDRRIAALHRQFMSIGGPTDVITFQHGEIVISAQTAQRQGRSFRNSLARELQLYIVHGLLHLRGFDDKKPGEARRMQDLQEQVLRRLARKSS